MKHFVCFSRNDWRTYIFYLWKNTKAIKAVNCMHVQLSVLVLRYSTICKYLRNVLDIIQHCVKHVIYIPHVLSSQENETRQVAFWNPNKYSLRNATFGFSILTYFRYVHYNLLSFWEHIMGGLPDVPSTSLTQTVFKESQTQTRLEFSSKSN